jgi:hypothetical protein
MRLYHLIVDSFSPTSRRRLTAILFLPPRGSTSWQFFFSSLAAAPHGNYFSPTLRQRLTAILFFPPHGGTSWQFFLSRLAAAPHGDSFCSALQ